MVSIKYRSEVPTSLPDASNCDMLASYMRALVVLYEPEKSIETTISSIENSMLHAPIESKTSLSQEEARESIPVKYVSAVLDKCLSDNNDIESAVMIVDMPWPYSNVFASSFTVGIGEFAVLLREHMIEGVSIPLARLLQIAGYNASSVDVEGNQIIDDSLMCGLIMAYYCSFDEKMQAVLYPDVYASYASNDAVEYEMSSMLAYGAQSTGITSMSATSAWLEMIVQSPMRSILSDFILRNGFNMKSHADAKASQKQASNLNTESDNSMRAGEANKTLGELCDMYIADELPAPYTKIREASTEKSLELMVADSITEASPASVPSVVFNMLIQLGADRKTIDAYVEYCHAVEKEASKLATTDSKRSSIISISPDARNAIMRLNDNDSVLDSLLSSSRVLIASAAYARMVSNEIEYGDRYISDIILTSDDVQDCLSACELMNRRANGKHVLTEKLDDNIEIMLAARKMSDYDTPSIIQHILIGWMAENGRSIITSDDIRCLATGDPMTSAILSDRYSEEIMHAGVDKTASDMLAMASILYGAMVDNDVFTEQESVLLYASILMISYYSITGGDHCSDICNWIGAVKCDTINLERMKLNDDAKRHRDNNNVRNVNEPGIGSIDGVFNIPSGDKRSYQQGRSEGTLLQYYGTDMVELARNGEIGRGITGRDAEIELIETVLSRRDKSNPILLAPAGAGKTAIVEAIAKRIADGESKRIGNMGLVSLDLPSIVSSGSIGTMAVKIEQIFQEAVENNIIIFIDEVHMITSLGTGDVNVGNILKPLLARNGVHVIGATTEREYNYTIAKDKALARRFSPIRLKPMDFDSVVNVIDAKSGVYNAYHGILSDRKNAKTIALLSADYMSTRMSPDRELEVLDTSESLAASDGMKHLDEEHIIRAVSLLTGDDSIRTRRQMAEEADSFDKLGKKELDKSFPYVAGQYDAKKRILKRLTEAKLGISPRTKPKSIFMFIGDSGVGKTYMAHQIAPLLGESESDVLTINLAEYRDSASYTRLIGASPQYVGYNEGGILTNFAKAHPSGIVILDEIDKCHAEVLQMLLGVFDTGMLQASDGSTASFKSITFICTANIAESARHHIGFNTAQEDEQKIREAEARSTLKERLGEALVNRIDEIVVFNPLTINDISDICAISYNKMSDMLESRYDVKISDAVSEKDIRKEAKRICAEYDTDKKRYDARTIWSLIEPRVSTEAIKMLARQADEEIRE